METERVLKSLQSFFFSSFFFPNIIKDFSVAREQWSKWMRCEYTKIFCPSSTGVEPMSAEESEWLLDDYHSDDEGESKYSKDKEDEEEDKGCLKVKCFESCVMFCS